MGVLIFFAVIVLLFGAFIGYVITSRFYIGRGIGTIRVDQSDPEDNPYLFLELDKPISAFRHKKIAILKVKNENYISHD